MSNPPTAGSFQLSNPNNAQVQVFNIADGDSESGSGSSGSLDAVEKALDGSSASSSEVISTAPVTNAVPSTFGQSPWGGETSPMKKGNKNQKAPAPSMGAIVAVAENETSIVPTGTGPGSDPIPSRDESLSVFALLELASVDESARHEQRQFGYAGGSLYGNEEVERKGVSFGGTSTEEFSASESKPDSSRTRPKWNNRAQFVLVLAGYAIGLGNIWRFPYLCGRHGGGTFLLIYLVCLVFIAYPLFYLELVLGQWSQKGPVQAYQKIAPNYSSLAYIIAWMDLGILSYYQVVICWVLIYWCKSWNWAPSEGGSGLPWANQDTSDYFEDQILTSNSSRAFESSSKAWGLNGHLVVSLFFVWLITGLCLVKGIHSAGKVAYVTVIMPFILMTILFFAAVSLPGAGQGVAYYLTPKIANLFDLDTWSTACGQILFSLSPCTGAAIALASFNDRHYAHLQQDSLTIAVTNSGFSVFSGFVVFSVAGNLAQTENKSIEEVAQEGPGLAFVMFPRVLTQFNAVFSWLFFTTLLMLGLDSAFAWVQTLVTYCQDYIEERERKNSLMSGGNQADGVSDTTQDSKAHRQSTQVKITIGICGFIFLLGLQYCTHNGVYLLDTVDHFCPTYCLLFSACMEFYMFGRVLGIKRVESLIQDTSGGDCLLLTNPTLNKIFHFVLQYLGVGVCGSLLLFTLIGDLFLSDHGENWGLEAAGWTTVLIPVLGFLYKLNEFRITRFLYGGASVKSMTGNPCFPGAAGMGADASGFTHSTTLEGNAPPTAIGRGYPTLYVNEDVRI